LEIDGTRVGIVLFVWGVAAAAGVTFGGALNDRFGPKRVILSSLALLATAFLTTSISVHLLSPVRLLSPRRDAWAIPNSDAPGALITGFAGIAAMAIQNAVQRVHLRRSRRLH
jgi:predicted MFS family arabinose efflux permease